LTNVQRSDEFFFCFEHKTSSGRYKTLKQYREKTFLASKHYIETKNGQMSRSLVNECHLASINTRLCIARLTFNVIFKISINRLLPSISSLI